MHGEPDARVSEDEHRVERREPEHASAGRLRRHHEQSVVAAGAQAAGRSHREAAEAVRDQPLASRRRVEISAELAAEAHGA